MLLCLKKLLKPKSTANQDKGNPKNHEEERKAKAKLPPHLSASEGSRGSNVEESGSRLNRRSRNLWQEAFVKLDDVQQDLLFNIEKSQGRSVVQDVADETEKRYRDSQEEGWKIHRGDKRDINLRAAAEKILSSVLWSKKLIDAGVAFDPTGYSAIAWTIVSLGLQMAQNDVDRVQALFDASGFLTDTLTRCAAIEASYGDKVLPDSEHLEDTIVDVYVAILEFSAEIVSQNRLKIVRRVLTSIQSLAEQPLQDLKTKLNSKEKNLRRWTKVIEHQYRKLEMKEIDEKIDSTLNGIEEAAQQLSSIKSAMLSAEEHIILKWFSEYDFSASHKSAASQRESGTGAWILDHLQYGEWKMSDNSLLWLYGNSGSGKTVLCSKIVDDLEDLCTKNPSYALAYWYFTFSNQSSLDIDNLLCSIIRQLCARTQTLPAKVRELWKNNYAAGSRPTRAIVMEVLNSLIIDLKAANQDALVVLDALDEYPMLVGEASSDVQQTSGRKDVLLWLQQFCAKHKNVHVMIVSRDENDIRDYLDEALKVDVAKCVVDDLQLFIPNCIDRIVKEHRWKARYTEAMSSRIEGISEKRFRWASLMQRRFSVCLDHERMQQALETLPDSLEDMYTDVLVRQIPKDYREKARLMLMWLTYSIRPLTLRELAFVADLPNPMDVRRICTSSLVTLSREVVGTSKHSERTTWNEGWMHESEEEIVKFDHFSVKEYMMSEGLLASSRDSASYFFVPPLLAHLSIAQLSVSHLLATNGSHFTKEDVYGRRPTLEELVDSVSEQDVAVQTRPEKPWPESPLLEYSTFWHRHVWQADAIDARLTPFDATKPNFSKSKAEDQSSLSRAENLRIQIHRLFCGTFSQSFKNWVLLLDLLTSEKKYPGVPSMIWCASLLNLPDSVQRLLQSETDYGRSMIFDCFSARQPNHERTPIGIAAVCGHLKVLSVLLETDMPVEQSDFGNLVRDLDRNAGAVLNAILKSRPHLTITERIVERTYGGNSQTKIYRYILDSPGLVNLSKAMFEFIVKNFWNPSAVDVGFVEAVLRRGDSIGYSRGEMIEVSVHGEGCGRSSELFSGRYHPPSVSQKVLELMVVNESSGSKMLAVLLEHYKGVQISRGLLALMITNIYHGARMFETVLEYDKGVQVGQDLLTLMVAEKYWGTDMLAVVLKHRKGIHISQDLLVAVGINSRIGQERIIELILEYDETIEVSEDMLKAAAGNPSMGAEFVSAILSHDKNLEVSEGTLIAAAENEFQAGRIFSFILSHDKKIEVSEDILRAAARNDSKGGHIFSAILSHTKNIIISMEVICAIAENNKLGIHMMNLLMDHGSCDLELHGHFKFFGGLEEVMSDKLELHTRFDNCELSISQEMMEAAARWEPDVIDFLVAHKRSNVTFTRSTTRPISHDSNL